MGKDRSFVAKLSKAAHLSDRHCPECGEVYHTIKVIKSTKDGKQGSWRFRESFVAVCKCNEKEVMGA